MLKKSHSALIAFASLFLLMPSAYAVDLDDDIKPDNNEHIAYSADANAVNQTSEIEKKYPTEAAEIREALQRHIAHANTLDLEGYLSDFLPERVRYPELDRDYAKRAMAQKNLKLEIHSIEFSKLSRTSATVHTRQIASYINDEGIQTTDDAIISYRWLKDANDQVWKIAFTERKHLINK